ncbi:MAG TPA: hypothetical protein VMN36_00620 [Verrucomicrobiales bacterium]|nr:hypothetical protein [Verrucomicrobiales bacterium]
MELPASGFAPFLLAPDAALNPIARDGTGMTVHATERRSGSPVYLRVFPASELASDQRQQGFVGLARTLIENDPSCFTRIVDTGCEDNLFYYAMQADPGALLEKWTSVRPLGAEALVRLLTRCLEGLSEAQIYPGLIPRLWAGNIHLTSGPDQAGYEVRLLLHHLVPARPPLDEPSALPPECSGAEPENVPGAIFSVGILLERLLREAPEPAPPELVRAAHHLSAPDPSARPTSFADAVRILESSLSGSVSVLPVRPPAPPTAAPEQLNLDAVGRLMLELTRRAQAELHLTSRIDALEARLRDSESAKHGLEEEMDVLRRRAISGPKPSSGSVPPESSPRAPSPARTRAAETRPLDGREIPEIAAPWILWCALGALAALLFAALYLLFQTLNTSPRPLRMPPQEAGLSAPGNPAGSSAIPFDAGSGLRLVHLESLEMMRQKDWLGILAVVQELRHAPNGGPNAAELRQLAAALALDLESSLRHVPTIASEEGFRQLHEYLAAVQQEPQPASVP